ncbi:MAG: hypothetical protein IPK97_08640 [Ahniella sp.]|nr:hypothetical protein [Ahniella sp.]
MTFDRSRPALFATVLGMLLTSGASNAAMFCATTGDQLATALNTADSNNTDDEIRVSVGFKTRPGLGNGQTRWVYLEAASDADNDLILTGGWNAACTTKFPSPPSQLDAELGGSGLDIQLTANSVAAITVSDIEILRGYTNTSFNFSGLRVTSPGAATPLVMLDRVRVRNSGSDGDSSGIVRLELNGGNLTLRNSQISQNRSFSGASLIANAGAGGEINVNNNTVIDNTDSEPNAAGAVGGVSLFGAGIINAYNNVFFDNTSSNSSDLAVASGVGVLSNNHIGILRGTPAANANRTQGDPRITFNNSWYTVLAANSPLRDSGSTFVPTGAGANDLQNQPRVQGARIDRGAVEFDQMFGNGFE